MTAATVSADPRITDAREVLAEVREAEWPGDRDSGYLIGRAFYFLADVLAQHDRMVADEEDPDGIEAAADQASEAAIALKRVLGERREHARKALERAKEWRT
jgi:hypothetical protein